MAVAATWPVADGPALMFTGPDAPPPAPAPLVLFAATGWAHHRQVVATQKFRRCPHS
ncbi:hypothetical protein [Saccharothrix sp.]|uniref:hypothetical protein n=1 Tax=Saccharothrix sp. TaxID=1873460 RepID=UPI002811AD37|nr:hypothetical protein [Saccharothrix sp.]